MIPHALLDTDTLSELCRGNLRVVSRAQAYLAVHGRLTTSAVTAFERRRGYQVALREGKPYERQQQAFEALLATCTVIPFDDDAASVAAKIWAAVTRSQRSGLGDLLIAATAVSRGLPVITRNRRDFAALSRAAGLPLTLIDWSAAAS